LALLNDESTLNLKITHKDTYAVTVPAISLSVPACFMSFAIPALADALLVNGILVAATRLSASASGLMGKLLVAICDWARL